jgi:hypothetical protein
MIYPDTRCWDNYEKTDNIDSENFMKNTGIVPRAFKAMIDRMTGAECTEYDS